GIKARGGWGGYVEARVVEPIVHCRSELKSMGFWPGHLEAFQDGQVHVPEMGAAQGITITDYAMRRVAKGSQCCGRIFEELNASTGGVNIPLDCRRRSSQDSRAVEIKPYR